MEFLQLKMKAQGINKIIEELFAKEEIGNGSPVPYTFAKKGGGKIV